MDPKYRQGLISKFDDHPTEHQHSCHPPQRRPGYCPNRTQPQVFPAAESPWPGIPLVTRPDIERAGVGIFSVHEATKTHTLLHAALIGSA